MMIDLQQISAGGEEMESDVVGMKRWRGRIKVSQSRGTRNAPKFQRNHSG